MTSGLCDSSAVAPPSSAPERRAAASVASRSGLPTRRSSMPASTRSSRRRAASFARSVTPAAASMSGSASIRRKRAWSWLPRTAYTPRGAASRGRGRPSSERPPRGRWSTRSPPSRTTSGSSRSVAATQRSSSSSPRYGPRCRSVSSASLRGPSRPRSERSWRLTTKDRGGWNGAAETITAARPATPAERTNSRRVRRRPLLPVCPHGRYATGRRLTRAPRAQRVTVTGVTAILDGLKDLMVRLVEALGYAGLAFLSLLENLVPPIPSEFVLPFAGFLVAEGELSAPLVLVVTAAGGFVGTTAFYWLGMALGETRVRAFIARYGRYVLLRVADYDDALAFFQRHDAKVVFWARF